MKTEILKSVQLILNKEHKNLEKRRIDNSASKANFACPYCGDSYDDERKKRGWIYWDSMMYHCFNGGCNKHRSVLKLIDEFNRGDDLSYNLRMNITMQAKTKSIKNSSHYTDGGSDILSDLESLSVSLDDFFKLTNSRPIMKDGAGWDYLTSRALTRKRDELFITKNALVIPNFTPDLQRVIGYQIRIFDPTRGAKYMTFNNDSMRTKLGLPSIEEVLPELEPSDVDKLNSLSNLHNILRVDYDAVLTVFEGPIDSMFMSNSIALCGLKRISLLHKLKNIRYLLDNDDDGLRTMNDEFYRTDGKSSQFKWSDFIWKYNLDKYNIKDLNDLILHCYKNNSKIYKNIENYFSKGIFDTPR